MKSLAILIGAAMLLPCFTPSAEAGHRRHVRVVCRPYAHRCHGYVWSYHHHHRGHHHHWRF